MSSTFVQVAGGVGRKVLVGTVLSFIGLIVGFGCALLPPTIPFAIVGIAGVLLLWVLPELASVPDRWCRRMVPIMLFAFICVPSYYAIILPGLPWIQIRRVVQYAWLIPLIIVVASSAAVRSRIAHVLRASRLLAVCTLGFMLTTVITLPTAVYPSVSMNYVLNSFTTWFIPMFGVIACVRDEELVLRIFKFAMVGVAINFVIGAIEYRLHHTFLIYALPTYMREQIFAANPIAATILPNGFGYRGGDYRASSTYTTPLSWGENCAMLLPFGLHFLTHRRSVPEKWFGAIGIVMCIISVVLSGSRGAFAGMIVATVAYSIAWSFRSNIINKASLAGKIGLTLFSVAAVVALLAIMFVDRVHRAVLGNSQGQASTEARYAQWASAKPKILARPILGYGGGSAGDIIHYATSAGGFTVDGYHMNLLVDYGVPGCSLFFATFLIAAAVCLKRYVLKPDSSNSLGNALSASIIAFTVYRTTLSQNDSLTLAYMLIGLVFVYLSLTDKREVRTASSDIRAAIFHRAA